MSGLVGNPEDRFSHNEAQIRGVREVLKYVGVLALWLKLLSDGGVGDEPPRYDG